MATTATTVGVQVGTPAYMAPEQRAGRPVDARADQFAFCVSLFEALFGVRPAIDVGTLRIPRRRGVPAAVRKLLSRGLDPAPDGRFARMESLLPVLERSPVSLRRVGYTTAAVLCSVALTVVWQRGRSARICRGAEQHLHGVWDEERSRVASAAFSSSGRSFAADAWAKSAAAIDGYARAWVQQRTDACEASRVRGDQSDQVLALRMECLDRRLVELGALVDLFTRADGLVVEKAVSAASSLVPLSSCSDLDALKAQVRPPEDPVVRGRVEALRRRLADARALEQAGKFTDGLQVAQTIAPEASGLGYRPVLAEALYHRGTLESLAGDPTRAVRSLFEAVSAAEGSRHDELAAEAWSAIICVHAAVLERPADAKASEERALAAVERLGDRGAIKAELLDNLGLLRREEGRFAEAVAQHEAALQLTEKVMGSEHPRVAQILQHLGVELREQRHLDEAIAAVGRALAIQEKVLGAEHPDVADTLNSLANINAVRGDYAKAQALSQRALDLRVRTLGASHDKVAESLGGLGNLLISQGRYAEAVPLLERSLAIDDHNLGRDSLPAATVLTNIGYAYVASGDPAHARSQYERALSIRLARLGPQHPLIAVTFANLGRMALELRNGAEALADYQRALTIYEATLKPDHLTLAFPLTGIGRAFLLLGQPTRAVPPLERALKLRESGQVPPEKLAETCLALAHALWDAGGDRKRARALALQARDAFSSAGPVSARDRADAVGWLAKH
jgi:tetratricopeptide (TPR) repeat protein